MIVYNTDALRISSPLSLIPSSQRAEAWAWLLLYAEKVMLEVRLFGWTVARIRLRDLFPIFERILGRRPSSVV